MPRKSFFQFNGEKGCLKGVGWGMYFNINFSQTLEDSMNLPYS